MLSILLKTRYCGINHILSTLSIWNMQSERQRHPFLQVPTPFSLRCIFPKSICSEKHRERKERREGRERHTDWVKEGGGRGSKGKKAKCDASNAEKCAPLASQAAFQSPCSTPRFFGTSQISIFFTHHLNYNCLWKVFICFSDVFLQKKAFRS